MTRLVTQPRADNPKWTHSSCFWKVQPHSHQTLWNARLKAAEESAPAVRVWNCLVSATLIDSRVAIGRSDGWSALRTFSQSELMSLSNWSRAWTNYAEHFGNDSRRQENPLLFSLLDSYCFFADVARPVSGRCLAHCKSASVRWAAHWTLEQSDKGRWLFRSHR